MGIENNKGKIIARNTSLLYIRMLLVIAITLYSSRLILKELGFVDFGLYNVVAGFVSMFVFFGNSLSNAAQRFFSIELGRKDYDGVKLVFNVGMILFFMLSLVIVAILETLGLWFIYNKLNIPADRFETVLWVFHLSVIVVFFNVNNFAFRAFIVAKENMNFYAKIGISEAVLKLIIIIFLGWMTSVDKLLMYSILFLCVTIIVNLIYSVYCILKYEEIRFNFGFDKKVAKSMFSFIGWSSFVSLIEVGNIQGANVLLNMFFGPVINAARGIAYQVSNTIQNFGHNIYVAVRPQMIKSYAVNDTNYFIRILNSSSKAIYFFVLTISVPLFIKLPLILDIWLDAVPDKTVEIGRLLIIATLIDSLRNPLWASAQANGNLKNYSLYGGIIMLIYLPLSYFILRYFNGPVEAVFYILIAIRFVYLIVIWFIVKSQILFLHTSTYLKEVIIPIIITTILVPLLPLLASYYLSNGYLSVLYVSTVSVLSSVIIFYFFGLSKVEKKFVVEYIQERFKLNANK